MGRRSAGLADGVCVVEGAKVLSEALDAGRRVEGLYVVAGLALGMMTFTAAEIATAFGDAIQGSRNIDAPLRYCLNLRIFRSMGTYPIVAGAAASLIQTIWALSNLDDIPTLTHAMAAALLPLWLGLGFKFFVLYPFEIAIEKSACLTEAGGI